MPLLQPEPTITITTAVAITAVAITGSLHLLPAGIAAGMVLPQQANLVDITPTIMALAGGPLRDDFDGLVLPLRDDLKGLYYRTLYNATVRLAALPPVPPAPAEAAQLKEAWRRDT